MFKENELMNEIISLCKRRGFIFHSSEIYGGLQGVYDYGPLGIELKNNLKSAWWKSMVYENDNIEGLDSSIITHRCTLKNSGHESTFSDPMVDCKKCKSRLRADFVINNACPNCGSTNLTESRMFNLMFKTHYGPVEDPENFVYLRPETAQGIFVNFKNVQDSMSKKIPFGIAQIGKAFRNEVTPRNFIFRMREFEQMELEFFVENGTDEKWHEIWVQKRLNWWCEQGLQMDNLQLLKQNKDDLSHYSKATTDILFKFPHGMEELEGIANRQDFDLGSHSKDQTNLNLKANVLLNKDSNARLNIQHNNAAIIPFVIEPSAGVDRGVLALITQAFRKENLENGERIVLGFKKHIAPVKVAVMPLAKNDEKITNTAQDIANSLRKLGIGKIRYEDTGNIGKAYRRNDEIGTPFCITVDFQSLEDAMVTIRERDSMQQERVKIEDVEAFIKGEF